jgi:rRNA maturation endonuclease Nob1
MRDKKKSGATIRYWLCQCRSCKSIFNVPQVRNRPLTMEIGKAKCPDCGSFLVRSNRVHGIPIRTITREQAKLV